MNILILTGRFGMGHYSAAKALEEEILKKNPNANIYTVDVIDYLFPKIGKLIYGGFGLMVSKCSFIYNFLNYFTENYIHLPVGRGLVNRMEKLVQDFDADVVAAMFPVCACFHKNKSDYVWQMKKEVLIMGGGLGLIPFSDNLLKWLSNDPKVHVTVITGTNRKLKEKLEDVYPNMEILGYVKNVDFYMHRADLIVTKAGGITTFEAIHTRTPLFVIRPFLEQEYGNAMYIEEEGIGKVLWSEDDSAAFEIQNLLEHSEELDRMKKNMSRICSELEGVWQIA